ncbi:GAF domain-containing protein [Aeromicrobium sp. YIM 150415]|uniref:helix-turn-helix domain-containing protein n=1 Tax=Aeromicrobium sp. YIM 150415 TaxID=2803912 RepID=UPI0019641B82|nr:GAF domain-containing protein [Aeromicrobium sp. YIM 150415]MBM9463988.1 GAF domain-containing protein [Aeromicrobium sp. YIM 150415]
MTNTPVTDSAELVAYRNRRERELNSLYASARSLTALGEVDEVLESIVRHAHELIGTDFAYLSLVQPDGSLTIKATQGTITQAFSSFNTASLPAGAGVGGRIIATGAPAWVSNYLQTPHLTHDEEFDSLVQPEGMVALLGVPLFVGEDVIGILFAADRAERPFEHDEIALLSAFADHAAVALNNARLYDETRSALLELQSAYQTIERHAAAVEQAQSVHEALSHVVLTGGGAAEVADLLVEHLGGAVTVFDRGGAVSAQSARDERFEQPARRPSPDPVEQARQSGRCATTTDRGGLWHSAATAQAGDTHLGAMLLTKAHEPSELDLRTLERAAQILGLLILKETAVADAEDRVSGELLTELLMSVPPVGQALRARAQARGVDIASLDTLVVAESPTAPAAEVVRRLHALSHEWGGLAGEHLGRATLLLEAGDADRTARLVHARLGRDLGGPVRVVVEPGANDQWGRAFGIASRCCSLMRTLDISDHGSTTAEYAMFAILFDGGRAGDLDRFLSDSIGSLLAYDARRSTALAATLAAYFEHAGNLTRTARALHVHMNTLLKRLDRVTSLLGEDWRSPDRMLRIQVALRLHTLRAEGRSPAAAEQRDAGR